jgi:hypothetical protein
MKRKIVFLLLILFSLNFSLPGAKYLIITHDNFYNAIQPLAQWKHKKGVPVKTVKLSEIGATPESIGRIKNYIVNAYNTWNPRPEYVLLVGSPEYIRTDLNLYDDFYANMTGDYKMEISIGRFPDSTVSQCSVIVAKTLAYERTPYTADTLWYKKGTCIIREDGSIYPDTIYWNDSRYIYGLWLNAGYVHVDTFSRLAGDSAIDVVQAIDNGRAFVTFRGQGLVNWWSPFAFFPDQTNNGFKLPIIVSGTCATMRLEPGGAYLGENFLRAGTTTNPKGAVAFLGTTNSANPPGLARLRGMVTTNIFKTIFVDNMYKLGDALKRAKFISDSISPSGWTSTRYREWNMLGDPELNIWTRPPKTLVVTHDSVIPRNATSLSVTVTRSGTPIQNALVCIMKDTILYQTGYTAVNGVKTFSITLNDTGRIYLTVTAQNCRAYEGTIRVRASGIEENTQTKIRNSKFEISPNPCRDFVTINSSKLEIRNSKLYLYDVQGRQIDNAKFTLQNSKLNLSELPAGVYMVFIKNAKEDFLGKLVKR